MYTKHHQARRQKAMSLMGHREHRVHRDMGGPLGETPAEEIGQANQILKNSASALGAKRGGPIRPQSIRKSDGGSLSACAYRRGGEVKRTFKANGCEASRAYKHEGRGLSEIAYKHGGQLKRKYKTHRHEDAAEDRKLIREELRKHDREMPHYPRSKMHHARKEHEHREKFAVGGAGKIRHKQMTLSGKPIPAPGRHRYVGL